MRLFKLLLRKCFREILRNIKQYISIIFIIAISITLYTGLDANALGLKNRVEDVYVKGNIADEWVTLNPQFGEYEKMDEDYEQIKKASGDNSTIEKRFYMQSTINSTTLNGLISDSIPKVNAPLNTQTMISFLLIMLLRQNMKSIQEQRFLLILLCLFLLIQHLSVLL